MTAAEASAQLCPKTNRSFSTSHTRIEQIRTVGEPERFSAMKDSMRRHNLPSLNRRVSASNQRVSQRDLPDKVGQERYRETAQAISKQEATVLKVNTDQHGTFSPDSRRRA